jgi:hypothetical protein
MDYGKLASELTPKVLAAIAVLNNPEIAPATRQLNQEILLREVGKSIYDKIYSMNAFDMEIPHTIGAGIDDRFYGLAKVSSSSVSNGTVGLEEYVRNYLFHTSAKAQNDAMSNARQSGKRVTVTRTEHGDACKWCQSLAGTYENPSSDVFKRHGGCEARIVTQGYKSRNGLLNNYKTGSTTSRTAETTGVVDSKGAQVVYRGTGKSAGANGPLLGDALYVARDKSTAAQFGNVAQLSMPIKAKDILLISTDNQLEKLQMDAQRWAVRKGASLDSNEYLPAYIRSLGYKAAEIKSSVDPFTGIAIVDPTIVKKMSK